MAGIVGYGVDRRGADVRPRDAGELAWAIMDHGLQALLSFIGGMFISAAGFGWFSAAKYFGLKLEMQESLREVRHQFTGSVGQERVWREEEDEKLEVRIRALEDYRSRGGGSNGGGNK